MLAYLKLEHFEFPVTLGWGEAERQQQQLVALNITIKFKQLSAAFNNDQLDDTICYDQLTKTILNYCADKSFRLIEYLSRALFTLIKENIAPHSLQLELIKLNPPIEQLKGGARIVLQDDVF